MDKLAEKLAGWFGSTPFIVFHFVWFGGWVTAHMLMSFDTDWANLTLVVSLEAIFLSLFILRAENIQSGRFEERVKKDLKTSKQIMTKIETLNKKV